MRSRRAKSFLSAADLLWLFVIGAFLGDMVETVFCRLTAGVWMSVESGLGAVQRGVGPGSGAGNRAAAPE